MGFVDYAISSLSEVGDAFTSGFSDKVADAIFDTKTQFKDLWEYLLKLLLSKTLQSAFAALIPGGGIGGLFSSIFGSDSAGIGGNGGQSPVSPVSSNAGLPNISPVVSPVFTSSPTVNVNTPGNDDLLSKIGELQNTVSALSYALQSGNSPTKGNRKIDIGFDMQGFVRAYEKEKSRMEQGGYNAGT